MANDVHHLPTTVNHDLDADIVNHAVHAVLDEDLLLVFLALLAVRDRHVEEAVEVVHVGQAKLLAAEEELALLLGETELQITHVAGELPRGLDSKLVDQVLHRLLARHAVIEDALGLLHGLLRGF